MSRKTSKKVQEKVKFNMGTQVEMDGKEIGVVYNHPDLISVTEYIKNKLYFATLTPESYVPRNMSGINFFSIDDELIYENFYKDFGPLNLSCLYKYCWIVNKKLRNPQNQEKKIVHYTSGKNEEKRANAAFLIAAYGISYLQKNPYESYRILMKGNHRGFRHFQDASMGNSPYNIRLQDCLNGLYSAVMFGFFNFGDFDIAEYDKYQQLRYGDLNWIVPGKFLAFIGPSTEPGSPYHQPERYIDYFLRNNVVAVVRLNRRAYDASRFTQFGINHYEMFLPDGSTPSKNILDQFLKLAERTSGVIAVHCKAGLGRTGCLISAYLIKHYNMTAKEAIAWTRICRPGSVIGHQQSWLERMQPELQAAGHQYRLQNYGNKEFIPHHERGIYSIIQKMERKIEGTRSLDYSSLAKRRKISGGKNIEDKGKSDQKRKMDATDLEKKNESSDTGKDRTEKTRGAGLFNIFAKVRPLHYQQVTSNIPDKPTSRDITDRVKPTSHRVATNLTQGDFLNKAKIRKLK